MMDFEAERNLETSLSIMRTIFVDLHQHDVTIEVLNLLISKKEMFLAVTDLFEKHQSKCLPIMSSAYKTLLLCREKDLKTLDEVMTTVETLRIFCEEIKESKFRFIFSRQRITHPRIFFINITGPNSKTFPESNLFSP